MFGCWVEGAGVFSACPKAWAAAGLHKLRPMIPMLAQIENTDFGDAITVVNNVNFFIVGWMFFYWAGALGTQTGNRFK